MFDDQNGKTWWGYDLTNPRAYTRCIKDLMKVCRATPEYQEWQKITKAQAGRDSCPICETEYIYQRAESHHYPEQLFSVIEEVLQERIHDDTIDRYQPLDIVKIVMDKHIKGAVNCVVLCSACHKRFHNGDPEIMEKVGKIFTESKNGREEEQE